MSLISEVNEAYQRVLDRVSEAAEPEYGDLVFDHSSTISAALNSLRTTTGLQLPQAKVTDFDLATPIDGEPDNPDSKKGFRSAFHRHAEFQQLATEAAAALGGAL